VGSIEILALAVALAMDAFAVAVATGLKLRCSFAQTARMAGAFGAFQFLMPVAGWFLGLTVRSYIEAFDHWVAFVLLAFVGGKMLYGAWKGGDDECADPTKGATLALLALATSIDALAVGISLAMLKADIWGPAAVIGLVCFCITAAGMRVGRIVAREGGGLAARANVLGGLVLMGIGFKILLEHGVFGA
jgi:putative Mn2+ efflux pump MntP